jgi:hypothetical protein
MKKTTFICAMSEDTQNEIIADLQNNRVSEEDIITALNSRLCDLEDTIDISKYL